MYAQFAKDDKKERFDKIAFLFEKVGAIEKQHEESYRNLLKNLQEGKVFEKKEKVIREYVNCGHKYERIKELEICPVCVHPKTHFKIAVKEY